MHRLVLFLLITFFVCAATAADSASLKVSDLDFSYPAKWKTSEPTSSMRKAQMSVPGKGEAGEIVFFHFGPGGAGGVKANVDRWLGQFVESREQLQSKVEEVSKNGRKITYVQAQGTYKSGPPGGALVQKANYSLLGAIIEAEQGSVFIRFTGPTEVVKESQADFKKMVEGGK